MAFEGTWQVALTKKERVEIVVTDALEAAIWHDIETYDIDAGPTRAQYEKFDTAAKAVFLATAAAVWGGVFLDYVESTGCEACDIVSAPQE